MSSIESSRKIIICLSSLSSKNSSETIHFFL